MVWSQLSLSHNFKLMRNSCRANLWTKQHPRKRIVASTTQTKPILPRRDFGPLSTLSHLSTLSSFHNNKNLSYFNQNKNREIEQQGNTDTTKHQGKLHFEHHLQGTHQSCLKKVLPSPDGQRLWLILGTPLPTCETDPPTYLPNSKITSPSGEI